MTIIKISVHKESICFVTHKYKYMKTCITALLVCIILVIIFQLFDQEQRASCNLNEYLKSCAPHAITACSVCFLVAGSLSQSFGLGLTRMKMLI